LPATALPLVGDDVIFAHGSHRHALPPLDGSKCFRFPLLGRVASCPTPRYKRIKLILIYAPLTTNPDASKWASLDEFAHGFWRNCELLGCFADG
jgi:hypothetical protein